MASLRLLFPRLAQSLRQTPSLLRPWASPVSLVRPAWSGLRLFCSAFEPPTSPQVRDRGHHEVRSSVIREGNRKYYIDLIKNAEGLPYVVRVKEVSSNRKTSIFLSLSDADILANHVAEFNKLLTDPQFSFTESILHSWSSQEIEETALSVELRHSRLGFFMVLQRGPRQEYGPKSVFVDEMAMPIFYSSLKEVTQDVNS
eukprot:maker-scaffold2276_size17716-snap-gene-0.9 protein:Tk06407 transcript:maker-scaffold2276_size17716-snap-gene-0.9-mRNA-1 annotation:"purine-rich element-binding protein gamma"